MSTSPKVVYTYVYGASGKILRRTGMTYPDATFGVAVRPAYDFGTAGGANDVLNRVGRIHQSLPAREFVGTATPNQTRAHNVANEITPISPSAGSVTHDAAGNTTSSRPGATGTWSQNQALKWDAWNRLVARATDTTYRFDALHRRITKTVSSAIRHFYYSDQWQIVEERVGSATTADNQYVWGMRYIDELIYRKRGSTERYVITDYFHPVAITDTTGTVVERFGYTPFGVVRFMTAAYDNTTDSEAWCILYAGN